MIYIDIEMPKCITCFANHYLDEGCHTQFGYVAHTTMFCGIKEWRIDQPDDLPPGKKRPDWCPLKEKVMENLDK
ncbi:MAG: hypothetical protein J6Y78_15995 [Paludibacteraceae bacterium]|nr:hypothetical protein [Paludibacteraceae bacterium]